MQKKLIALAVAGLVSAPAFAQSNVTVYGIADAYVGIGSHGDNDFRGVGSAGLSGSRIGFRGTEDLGNGLKAVFTVEQGFSIDTGSGLGDASRQAFVGLNGAFGTVSLGRQYAPGYHATATYDVFGAAAVSPRAILVGAANGLSGVWTDGVDTETIAAAKGLSIAPNSAARWNNSVAYTGSFSGLTARAIYSFNGVETNTYAQDGADVERTGKPGDDDAMGVSLDYANGPLSVGATYHLLKNDAEDQKEWMVAGGYDFGVLKLIASYQQAKNVGFEKDNDAKLWQVGALVPVGAAGNVHVAYGEVKYDWGSEDPKAKSFGLAYTHALSKRTTGYVGMNYTKNDDGLGLGAVGSASAKVKDLPVGGGTFTGTVAETGEKSKIFVVGVRHAF